MEEFIIEKFIAENGTCPFDDWLGTLDKKIKGRVMARLARIRSGNLGDVQNLGQGLYELRFDFGPGYRIYFSRQGKEIIILLAGGDKGTQTRDITIARGCMN